MFIIDVLKFFHISVEVPPSYGLYHIICWVILVGLIVATVLLRKKISDKALWIILISVWGVMVLGEVYRELVHSVDYDDNTLVYNWAYFPFQFCSTPLYVLPCAVFIKHEKTRQFFYDFLATYALFAGLIVMIIPGDVFCDIGLINVQTMLHHGGMVAVAVLLYATNKVKFSVFTVLRATAVFATMLAIAMIMNATIPQEGFNMFYIDWVEGCHLPIIGEFDELVPYPVFLLIYTLGFVVCATVMHSIAFGADCLRKVFTKEKSKK